MKNMKVTLEEEEAKVCYETFQKLVPKSDGCQIRNCKAYTDQKIPLCQNPMWQQREKKEYDKKVGYQAGEQG